MRILLLGATGLIGSAVAARLTADGHELVGIARCIDTAARRVAVDRWIALNLRDIKVPSDWLPHLNRVEAVVNCAGALQASLRDSLSAVHVDASIALWQACEQAQVRKVVHFSAIGVDRGGVTDFSRTKAIGDLALESSRLDWVILRPSVVVGRSVYGGSALFRALASLPLGLRMAEAGPLDIVQLDDVAETVVRLLRPNGASRIALELAGPDRLDFAQVVAAYRRWLGWGPARQIALPDFVMALAWLAGDLLAWLGWRPPIRTTARREIARGAIGDHSQWREVTGIEPQSLRDSLAAEPASVQERWFARLYLLKPLVFGIFAAFWLTTGIVSLTIGWNPAVGLLRMTAAAPVAEFAVAGGAVVDLIVGLGILIRQTCKAALIAALFLSIGYIVLGTILQPVLWADPLGPMMKLWPILALNLVCLAILDER